MTKYYTGSLISVEDIKSTEYNLYFCNGKYIDCDQHLKPFYNRNDVKKFDILIKTIMDNKLRINNEVLNILKDILKEKVISYNMHENIIFELIEDQKGNLYGKELSTGLIFPIADNKKNEILDASIQQWNFMGQIDFQDHGDYKYYHNDPNVSSSHYYDSNGNCLIQLSLHFDDWYECNLAKSRSTLDCKKISGYRLKFYCKTLPYHNNCLRGDVFIVNDGYANEMEIDEYKKYHMVKGFFRRSIAKNYQSIFHSLAKCNIFKEEIIPKKEIIKEKEKIDDEAIILEEIELLLIKLKNYNIELYNKYQSEYNELLDSSNKRIKLVSFSKQNLEKLKAEISLCFLYNHDDGMNIIDYLSNLKKKYLLNIINGETNKTKVSLMDLDKIMDLFLKTQDEYDVLTRRMIIRNFACIYLFELYENKNNLDKSNLQYTHIENLMTSIIIILNSLKE